MGNEQLHGVFITTRDIYEQLVRLNVEVQSLNSTLVQVVNRSDDHESRIRALEKWRYTLPASLVLSVGSTILALIKITGG